MEFESFVDRTEIAIIKMVEQAGYQIEENTQSCLENNEYAGFLDKRKKVLIICTNNAKKRENYLLLRKIDKEAFERTALHIKKALRHEAVHVAQECNGGKLLNIEENLTIPPSKMKALNKSIKISGEEEKERQAYILESRPELVEKKLEKYCL